MLRFVKNRPLAVHAPGFCRRQLDQVLSVETQSVTPCLDERTW